MNFGSYLVNTIDGLSIFQPYAKTLMHFIYEEISDSHGSNSQISCVTPSNSAKSDTNKRCLSQITYPLTEVQTSGTKRYRPSDANNVADKGGAINRNLNMTEDAFEPPNDAKIPSSIVPDPSVIHKDFDMNDNVEVGSTISTADTKVAPSNAPLPSSISSDREDEVNELKKKLEEYNDILLKQKEEFENKEKERIMLEKERALGK